MFCPPQRHAMASVSRTNFRTLAKQLADESFA